MVRRFMRWVAAPIAVAGLVVLGAATPAYATSGMECAANSDYGTSCIKVYGTGLRVTDVLGYYTEPTAAFLQGKTWRFEMTKYSCDPRGLTKSECPPNAHYYTANRTTSPRPSDVTTCQSISAGSQYASMTLQQCENYGEAEVVASHGDFSTFSVPRSFSSNQWLCMEIQTHYSGGWHDNGAGTHSGVRGCAYVHS